MGDAIKVYKVKNQTTGEYRTAGGGWSKTGKTWNNIGHLKSSLHTDGMFNEDRELPSSDIVIIEIVVQETVGNTRLLADVIEDYHRNKDLERKYGPSFADLIERIEKDGQQDDWKWCLVIPYTINKSGAWEDAMMAQLKSMKLKMGKDYRKANSAGMAIAFKDRQQAMLARLSLPSEVKVVSLDIRNFVETNLDDDADSSV